MESGALPPALAGDTRVTRYRIDEIRPVVGPPPAGLEPGAPLVRVEATGGLAFGPGDLVGVTQHVVYSGADERRELAAISAAESGPVAVLIPIVKSAAWWALAQDERGAVFRGGSRDASAGSGDPPPGHFAVGRAYAARIFRRLYHSRYLPGSGWDFLTYFEFPRERAADFRALLGELRDHAKNPEWRYVERETEVWLAKR
jgi:hypothetical protein